MARQREGAEDDSPATGPLMASLADGSRGQPLLPQVGRLTPQCTGTGSRKEARALLTHGREPFRAGVVCKVGEVFGKKRGGL